MTKTVGTQTREAFVFDPTEAWRAGRRLDRSGLSCATAHPRGVWKASHAVFNAMDDDRSLAQAQRVAQSPKG